MPAHKGTRGPSRAKMREDALSAARAIEVPASCDVCVVGGGASGLVAAISAAEAGASVVVLERDLACGQKILATGNGRCNFCNVKLDPARYNQPEFVAEVCGTRWLEDVLDFFRESGLRWALEQDRLYPTSRQAASVRSVLLARAARAGVVLASARKVREVGHVDAGWRVSWRGMWEGAQARQLLARSVVLAVGGGCVEGLVSPLGIELAPCVPVLAPLACEPSPLAELDGRRSQVAATLYRGHLPIRRERGEALFRSYGLSGIVTFDLSRTAEEGGIIALDLAPDVSASELMRIIHEAQADAYPGSGLTAAQPRKGSLPSGALDGVLDPAIATLIERLARTHWQLPGDERINAPTATSEVEAAVALAKGLPFRVTGIAHPEQAQVTRGGIAVSQLDHATLALSGQPGLFTCGEAVDVDGDCGGFNLAWAWKSGQVAGLSAAQQVQKQIAEHAGTDRR